MPILGTLASSVQKITGSFESIATVTASGGEATLSFTSIPSTYTHLQIRGIGRSTFGNATNDPMNVRFNGITTSSYAYHFLYGRSSSVSADGYTPETVMQGGIFPNNGQLANAFGVVILDVHDYASTTKNKTLRSFSGLDVNGDGYSWMGSGLFMSTNAITSISFTHNNWRAGTTFALYGIKG